MEQLRVGIMGAGGIAATLANTMKQMPQVELYGIASRDKGKAEAFASRFQIPYSYGTYEEMVQDDKIELVYIATPHSEHCSNAKLCLSHGKHVLCEKAFAVNARQAEEMIAMAKEQKLMITEAMWVRYLPMAKTLRQVLDSGIIGTPTTLTANLCYLIDMVPRLTDPALAGGALLDVGVYTLTFASMVFGDEIEEIHSSVIKTETGVDAQNSITLHYSDGKMAVLNSSIRVISDRKGIIYGTEGFVIVENINNFESISVYNRQRQLMEHHIRPQQITGYEYQIEAAAKAIKEGQTECPDMPHKVTVDVMGVMDELRKQWDITYPCE